MFSRTWWGQASHQSRSEVFARFTPWGPPVSILCFLLFFPAAHEVNTHWKHANVKPTERLDLQVLWEQDHHGLRYQFLWWYFGTWASALQVIFWWAELCMRKLSWRSPLDLLFLMTLFTDRTKVNRHTTLLMASQLTDPKVPPRSSRPYDQSWWKPSFPVCLNFRRHFGGQFFYATSSVPSRFFNPRWSSRKFRHIFFFHKHRSRTSTGERKDPGERCSRKLGWKLIPKHPSLPP